MFIADQFVDRKLGCLETKWSVAFRLPGRQRDDITHAGALIRRRFIGLRPAEIAFVGRKISRHQDMLTDKNELAGTDGPGISAARHGSTDNAIPPRSLGVTDVIA